MVELESLRDRAPRQLSGGQQQRVALARALAIRPAVLLLDEPLSNLDAQLRMRMGEEIRALIRRLETTTVFVTHDQEEALALADRIVVMNRGRAEQAAAPKELYERPESRFVAEFIGLCNLFEGTLVASGRDGMRVRTRTGVELLAQAGDHRPALGDAVVVAVRPEHVVTTDQREGPNRIRGAAVQLGVSRIDLPPPPDRRRPGDPNAAPQRRDGVRPRWQRNHHHLRPGADARPAPRVTAEADTYPRSGHVGQRGRARVPSCLRHSDARRLDRDLLSRGMTEPGSLRAPARRYRELKG